MKKYGKKKKPQKALALDRDVMKNELLCRRNALSEIRDTSYKIVAAASAAGITLIWLLVSECNLSLASIILLNFFVAILTCFIVSFLKSLHRGFQNNREIMIKLENKLGLYKGKILPDTYRDSKVRSSDFMILAKRFVIFISASIIIVSWITYIQKNKTIDWMLECVHVLRTTKCNDAANTPEIELKEQIPQQNGEKNHGRCNSTTE